MHNIGHLLEAVTFVIEFALFFELLMEYGCIGSKVFDFIDSSKHPRLCIF